MLGQCGGRRRWVRLHLREGEGEIQLYSWDTLGALVLFLFPPGGVWQWQAMSGGKQLSISVFLQCEFGSFFM